MYYLLLLLLYPLSLIPLRLLYILSDAAYILLYHITGYRKKVVLDNLQHAFPEKTEAERKQIMKRFYRSFCDQWIETLKLLSISSKALNKRIKGNWEVFRQLNDAGLDTYALLGHTFNWEWANVACHYNCKQQFAGVYQPLNNKAFNRIMQRLRTRSGGWLISISSQTAFRRLNGMRYIVGLIADQNPSNMNAVTWLPFMNREVPFFRGMEQLPRRAKAAVVFAGIKKIKRGHYEIKLETYTTDASQLQQGDISRAYINFMEQQLKTQPENWLWTHKRWKHKPPTQA